MANANQKRGLYEYTYGTDSGMFEFASSAPIVVDWNGLTPEIRHALMAHGLKQKIADGAAMSRNPETGRPATDADKIARMRAIADRLMAGQWRAEAEGGATGGLLLRALLELYPNRTREDIIAYLEKRSDKEKAQLRATAKVAPIIERLRAEAGKGTSVDVEAMLDELN